MERAIQLGEELQLLDVWRKNKPLGLKLPSYARLIFRKPIIYDRQMCYSW